MNKDTTCKNGHEIDKLAGDSGKCELCGEVMCKTYSLGEGVTFFDECQYQPVYTMGERDICRRHDLIDDVSFSHQTQKGKQ